MLLVPTCNSTPACSAWARIFLEVIFVQALVNLQIREQQSVDFERRGIPDQLRCFPVEGTYREIVESQPMAPRHRSEKATCRGDKIRRPSATIDARNPRRLTSPALSHIYLSPVAVSKSSEWPATIWHIRKQAL